MTPAQRALLADARTATLATIAADGTPRLVPICFVLIDDVLWTPIDDKPKAIDDPRRLARVSDMERDPRVTILVDRWSEDWTELAWVRIVGRASLVASRPPIVAALRAKYPQYRSHDLESRPMIAVTIERVTGWSASAAQGDAARRSIE